MITASIRSQCQQLECRIISYHTEINVHFFAHHKVAAGAFIKPNEWH